ncbi:la-related protein 7 [Copidosoma floridanum]|uniref:la-related protein 7 n=1 Tax=Copidosoma floridanum TaxID=29053 RepID=UPI0006C9CCDF|nr:la-related protein 7 [Copidosoma floridanum]XP_014213598.1 la-related protein 7 [Copidosoma floridanum]
MVTEEHLSDMELASKDIVVPKVVVPEIQISTDNEKGNEVPRKNYRRRKKALYAALLKQMEFYFSDSNLAKDRFLADQVKECPDVPIEIFLKCNKIRSLTTNPSDIAGALKHSSMLQVSKNGTAVRRITQIVEKANVDDCTIYVERLPPNTDHEWLQSQFSKYGKVNYVSIPKFPHTNKIKGFAFIEFDSPEEAEKCLKDFKDKGCTLPSETPPEKMLSIATFSEKENYEKSISKEETKSIDNEKINDESLKSYSTKSNNKEVKNNQLSDIEKPETNQPEPDNTEENVEIGKHSEECLDNLRVVKEEKKSKKKKYDIQDSDQPDVTNAKKKRVDKESESNTEGEERKRERKTVHEKHKSSGTEHRDSSKSTNSKESDKDSDVCLFDSSNGGEEKRCKKRKNRHSIEEVAAPDAEAQKIVGESEKKHKKLKTEVVETESDGHEVEKVVHSEDNGKSELKKKKKRKNKHSDEKLAASDAEAQHITHGGGKKHKKLNTEESKVIETESDAHEVEKAVYGEETEESEIKKKKKRKNKHSDKEVVVSDAEEQLITDESEKKSKKLKTEESKAIKTESDAHEVIKAENEEAEESDEKKKKRKKRNRNYDDTPAVVKEHSLMGIQVMAKRDWKKLRNKYLNLQRTKMKQLKQHLWKVKWNQWGDRVKVEKMETHVEETESVNPASKLEFSPGLIVKAELNEPCIDPKSFKAELKSTNNNIKYVDIKNGSNVAYIRCDSAEAATLLSETASQDSTKNFKLLTGEEETCYWNQIKRDREDKCTKNFRQTVRGRKKLFKKAEKELGKHIKFDD